MTALHDRLRRVVEDPDVSATLEWDIPVPLDQPDLTPFDPAWIGGTAATFLGELAEEAQVPVDMPAVMMLGALSTAVRGRYKITVPWSEPTNLMCVVVAEPGNRKSEVFRQVFEPIRDFEREQAKEDARTLREWESRQRVLESQLRSLETALSDPTSTKAKKLLQFSEGDADLQRQAAVRALEEHQREKPAITQLIADDSTSEKLKSIMHDQGGPMAVASAEAAFFANVGGRYGEGPVLDTILYGHPNDPMRVDRVGREGEIIPRPCLTICVCMQPSIMRELGTVKGFRGNGAAARLLPSLPRTYLGFRRINTARVRPAIRDGWHDTLLRILRHEPPRSTDADGVRFPCPLELEPAAIDHFYRYYEEIHEPRMRPDGDLVEIQDWASKLPGHILRIAGLLHVLANDVPEQSCVTLTTVERAIHIGEYFVEHAHRMFELMEGRSSLADAETVLEAIRKIGEPLTRRDLHRSLRKRTRFSDPKSLDDPLRQLEELGWIQVVRESTGGRPSYAIFLNPHQNGVERPKTLNGQVPAPVLGLLGPTAASTEIETVTNLPPTGTDGSGEGWRRA